MSTESRNAIVLDNIQEVLDASSSSAKGALNKNQAQFYTPDWFARLCCDLLPASACSKAAFDPQCGERALLRAFMDGFSANRFTFGVELDKRLAPTEEDAEAQNHTHLTANCVRFWSLLDELFPAIRFPVQMANPPFGLRWKVGKDGAEVCDSTLHTWKQLLARAGDTGAGFMIANRSTIERMELHTEPRAYLYHTFPVGIFPEAKVEIGVLHFHGVHAGGPLVRHCTTTDPEELHRLLVQDYSASYYSRPKWYNYHAFGSSHIEMQDAFAAIASIIDEERRQQPPFNVFIDPNGSGYLRTYLSTRAKLERKLTAADIEKLARIDKCHPLTLTTERDTRLLLQEFVDQQAYTVQPEAKAAIAEALRQAKAIAVPIMPATDFESVAYADENEQLQAKVSCDEPLCLIKGKRYVTSSGTYKFTRSFQRLRMHCTAEDAEDEGSTYVAPHNIQESGQDRYIQVVDEFGRRHRFLERPNPKRTGLDHPDSLLWDLFERPDIPSVAETMPDAIRQNLAVMEAAEILNGFDYYPGQRDFFARVATRDYALVGSATGTGKSLAIITLIALKAPQRALIVAPQGVTKGGRSDDEDEVDDMPASQWVGELRRFAPGMQVFELFNVDDYDRILALNGGRLPHGIYISYYEAMFSNGAKESYKPGGKFSDRTIADLIGVPDPDPELPNGRRQWVVGIGEERAGIRCIALPCLATRIGHQFDFVALDEAHKATHLSSNVTQMILRMQPRYRYAVSATPIPNIVTDIFPIMGWLCVPGWYKGGERNPAWPYSRGEAHRFGSTFLTTERDVTQEAMNRQRDPKWRGSCQKASPVISSPARLLKIIKPTMAFISKEACNPLKPKATVFDVRVPMGRAQAALYGHFMQRQNVPHPNPMVRAALQVAILRDLCAAPAASDWNKVPDLRVTCNFNPKMAAGLGLVRDILARGEQVVIVSARLKQTAYIEQRLAEAGVPMSRIDSSFPAERHTEQAALFKQGRTAVMLMGIKCAQAHSFDQCRNLIVMSLEYTFGSFEQARGRIDRVTSKHPMSIWCVLHQNSIEEIMFDAVATKGDAATICLRGQRVPRDYVATDVGDVLARNFQNWKDDADLPDEDEIYAGWPALCDEIRQATAKHPCQVARKA